MTGAERSTGSRADFHVYYRRGSGKLFIDAMWGGCAEEVTDLFKRIAREMRWKVRVVKVVAVKERAWTSSLC